MLFPASRLVCILLVCSYTQPNSNAQAAIKPALGEEAPMSSNEVARTAGLIPLFNWLQDETNHPANPTLELLVRQRILQRITSLSLEVDSTSGQVDTEISEIKELQNYLEVKRERQINLLNLAGLAVGGSLGAASGSLGLAGQGKAAGIVGVVAGGITTTLSVIGLRQRSGSAQALQVTSNMLANLFDRPVAANNYYPAVVSAFMKSVASNEENGFTRKDRLIHNWIEVKRLPQPGSDKSNAKILRMTSMPAEGIKLSIGDLDDRQAMLYDFRAKLLYLKRELARFLSDVPSNSELVGLEQGQQ